MSASAATASAATATAAQPAAPGGPKIASDAKSGGSAGSAAAVAAAPASYYTYSTPKPTTPAEAIADLKALLTKLDLLQHLTACGLLDGVLTLAGKVPVAVGSELNMAVSDWMADRYSGQIKKVSRAGIKWIPRHVGQGQYELSPDDADLTEYHDDAKTLERKLAWAAARIKAAKHMVAYTGAGISTAAKIPDFRGPQGVWTRRDRGQAAPKSVAMEQAVPTLAHRAMVKLLEAKTMTYLVSQNVDGLHRRSGVPRDSISELHGNCYIELCANPQCKAEHLRTFDVCARHGTYFAGVKDEQSKSGISHITGRVCETCKKGMLRDSIIHFSENLPEEALQRALDHSNASDVALIVGTSLRVSPACDLPQNVKRNGGVMICCNLQATGKDPTILSSGGILVHAKCDTVMSMLLTKLGIAFTDTTQQELDAEIENFKKLSLAAEADRKAKEEATAKRLAAWQAKAKAEAEAAAAQAAADAKSAPPPHFFVGNSYAVVPELGEDDPNGHKWMLFVSTADNAVTSCAHFIEKVEVRLHETFHPRDFVLKPDAAPHGLTLTRLGWGTFGIQCTVHFVKGTVHGDRDPVKVVHQLVFDTARPWVATKVVTPPITAAAASSGGLFASLLGGAGSKLKPTATKVTTVTGESYIEPKANANVSGGSGSGSGGGSAGAPATKK